jgi:hypothetical protein
VAEVRVGRQVRAEARARGERARVRVAAVLTYERQHLFDDVAVVARQEFPFDVRRRFLVQEAVAVDAVDGVGANLPGLDVVLDGVNEVEALVFEIVGGGRGEHQKRVAGVAVGDERHLHPEVVAEPSGRAALHAWRPSFGVGARTCGASGRTKLT